MSIYTYMALLQQIRVIGDFFHSPLRSSCKHDEFAKSRLCTDKGQRRTLRRRTMNDRRETKLEHILDKDRRRILSHGAYFVYPCS